MQRRQIYWLGDHVKNTFMLYARGDGATKCGENLGRQSEVKTLAICAGLVVSFRCVLHRCPQRIHTLKPSIQRSVGTQKSSSRKP